MRARAPRSSPVALVLAFVSAVPGAAQAPGTDIFLAPLARRGDTLAVGRAVNLTRRPGYDNQPAFSPDGRWVYYTSERGGQTDLFRADARGGEPVRLTETPESEYSPTVMPGGARLSSVRVERDSAQRLWSFTLDGAAEAPLFEAIRPVGYHAWAGEQVAYLFVLGTPATLQRADRRTGRAEVVARNIGRTLAPVPGRDALSFLSRDSATAGIVVIDLAGGRQEAPIPALAGGSEFYAWTPRGELLMARDSTLFVRAPGDATWREVATFADPGLRRISRLAVSPSGDLLALVGEEGPPR